MIGTDAEHAVLGSCMGSKDSYRFAAEIITPDDFSHPDLGEVFDIIVGLGKRRVDVSLVAVATEVTRRQLKSVTQADVAGWFNVPGNSGTVAHYAGLVLEDATRRRASAAVAAAQQALMEGAERPSDVVGELTGRLNALSQGHGKALLEAKTLSEVLSVRDEFDWLIPGLLERRDRVVVTAGEGAGKALALDTPIPTPEGWTTMGALKVGQMVFGRDGKPTRITGATDVMHGRECFRVEFSDGSSVIADAEHQWTTEDYRARKVYSRRRNKPVAKRGTDQSWKHAKEGVRTTAEVRDTLMARDGFCLNHSVTVTDPVQYPDADLGIDPYVLGSWLGDGHSADGRMTVGDEDAEFVQAEFARLGHPMRKQSAKYMYGVPGLKVKLRDAGVLGNKHIPDAYMRASVDQRFALLQGLMDTDGYCGNRGRGSSSCEFSVSDERLARDVHELLLGLGYKVTFREGDATLRGRVVGKRYRLMFQSERVPFRLPRKAERVIPLRTQRSRRRFITAVVPVESVPVRCIAVDNEDRMYLCGREFIPTHNTTFIRQMAIASASGVNPITFQQIDPVKVLVIDAENSESQWRRQAMGMVRRGQRSGSADPGENVVLACSPRMNIVADKWLGAIHRLVEDHKPSMVCIGPLYRLAAGNLAKEEDMGQVLAALDTLRDKGLAMIIEAHAGHSKDANHNRELRPRGSSALMGWPEFGFGLARDPSMEGRVVLQRWRGDREERSWPDALDRGGAWPWVDAMALPHVRQAAYGNAAQVA